MASAQRWILSTSSLSDSRLIFANGFLKPGLFRSWIAGLGPVSTIAAPVVNLHSNDSPVLSQTDTKERSSNRGLLRGHASFGLSERNGSKLAQHIVHEGVAARDERR